MEELKYSNKIFLFPCMQQLIGILPNFSRMQMETKCAHVSNGHMREVGSWPGCGGAWLAGASRML
jgi:hypothetical protein